MNSAMTQLIKSSDVASGDRLRILLFQAESEGGGDERFLYATVMDETPKAVRVQLEAVRGATRGLWLPRRALTHLVRDRYGIKSRLARWWKPSDHQIRLVDACLHC